MAMIFVYSNDEYAYSDFNPIDDQGRDFRAKWACLRTIMAHSRTSPDRQLPATAPSSS